MKRNSTASRTHIASSVLDSIGETPVVEISRITSGLEGRYLKSQRRSISCYAIEPEDAGVLAGRPLVNPSHRIQGVAMACRASGPSNRPDRRIFGVSDIDAIDGARRLAKHEGIFGGFSSGAVLVAAEQLLRDDHAGKSIAIVLADSLMKYSPPISGRTNRPLMIRHRPVPTIPLFD